MNDPAQARGGALLRSLFVVLGICLISVIFILVDHWFEADLRAHPEVERNPDGRDAFALVVVLLDPSGSMGKPDNIEKAKYLVNEKIIPQCGTGDECIAFSVGARFGSASQVFPRIGCKANADETTSRSQCPDVPTFEDKQAVHALLSKLPKRSPGIRLGEPEQTLINRMPLLRKQEEAAHQDWIGEVSRMKPPPPRDDRSDICGALEAIGNRLKNSSYKERWFIALSDLKDDVRVRVSGRPRARGESSPCPAELGKDFEDVKTVLITPFEQIDSSAAFQSRWSIFFPSPIDVHALATVSEKDLLAKNPSMGLERFKRETTWATFVSDTPYWLWVAGAILLVAISWVGSRLSNSDQPPQPSNVSG